MPNIRSQSELILSLIDFVRLSQPGAPVVPGSVYRDLMLEPVANLTAQLYDELASVSNLQSIAQASGVDLDNLTSNYGLTRKTATKASGVVIFTFSSLPATVAINKGDLVYANTGNSFVVANGLSLNPNNSNLYKSIALKYKNDLDFLGITDPYAVEVTVQATSPGSAGNLF